MINPSLLGFSLIFALTATMLSAPQAAQALPDLQARKILPRSLDGLINLEQAQPDTSSIFVMACIDYLGSTCPDCNTNYFTFWSLSPVK